MLKLFLLLALSVKEKDEHLSCIMMFLNATKPQNT